jgi:hypothetical protein
MAAVVAVKKELRKKIKTILKDISDASAATQSRSSLLVSHTSRVLTNYVSYPCYQCFVGHARVQGSWAHKRLPIHAHWRDQHVQHRA